MSGTCDHSPSDPGELIPIVIWFICKPTSLTCDMSKTHGSQSISFWWWWWGVRAMILMSLGPPTGLKSAWQNTAVFSKPVLGELGFAIDQTLRSLHESEPVQEPQFSSL